MNLIYMLALAVSLPVQDAPVRDVPKELTALVGTFTGSWTMFGINDKGEVIPRLKWTDVMTASKPTRDRDRVFVETLDEITYLEPKYPVQKYPGKEGYMLKDDGSPGDYYIEMYGKVTRLAKVDDDVWTYSARASAQELTMLGFPQGSTGKHVVVKVVTREGNTEAHRISRVTTVNWTDKAGEKQWKQFISLQGVHTRK